MSNNVLTNKYTIIKDRVEIYKDFTLNLLEYIFDFYLDRETLGMDEDIKNYFMFCYNKVCKEFLEEEIDFRDNKELIDYFFTYYYHHFFKIDKTINKSYFRKFWENIFDIDKHKNKNILKVLVEIYAIFDKSITLKKNVLEFV